MCKMMHKWFFKDETKERQKRPQKKEEYNFIIFLVSSEFEIQRNQSTENLEEFSHDAADIVQRNCRGNRTI